MMTPQRTHVRICTLILAVAVVVLPEVGRCEILIEDIIGESVETLSVPPPEDAAGAGVDAEVLETSDLLEFINRDRLHGSLISVPSAEEGLIWKNDNVKGDVCFDLAGVSRIRLAGAGKADPLPQKSMVLLSNDDVLLGRIVSMDGKQVVLDTSYSGKVTIGRGMIKSIVPNRGAVAVVYEGPNSMAEWTTRRQRQAGQAWRYKNGVLHAAQQYPIGRIIDEKIPDMARIEFDAAWVGYPSFYFTFYTDNLQNYSGNCYMLQVGGASIYLQRYSKNSGSRNLGNVNYQTFNEGTIGKARFSMLVDKEKKSFTLLIDGNVIKQWTDMGDFAGGGNGILFQPQSRGDLRISAIQIAEWDGRIPTVGEASEEDSKEDKIQFINGDKVSGKVKSIGNSVMKFETSYATLEVPVERVMRVDMAGEEMERARRNKNDVRVHFRGVGAVTLDLVNLQDGTLKGRSENFGEVLLPINVCETMEFNIYTDKQDDDDD
ncbi:MAG: hypothetical protein E4H02_09955 [Lentisphaerales bacterium]|nr:MAG: hypothetical protein E4H02_09955 [Lentisphaerales bacterium]